METKVRVKGHTKSLMAWDSECGGEAGIAFAFSGEGGWVIPYSEIERLMRLFGRPVKGSPAKSPNKRKVASR